MTLRTLINVVAGWNQRWDDDASGREFVDANSLPAYYDWPDGVLINQADMQWNDRRTVLDAANDDLDLAGGVTNSRGQALTFARVKMIHVRNLNTVAGENLIIGGAANAFSSWLGAANDTLIVVPDGMIVLAAPSLAAYPVTAGTGDILRLSASGGDITYDISIVGCSS